MGNSLSTTVGGSKVGTLERIKGFIQLTRPHNLLATILTTSVGVLAATTYASIKLDNSLYLILPIATVVLITSAGYVINDYYDAEVDSINKPYRPIPSGRVSKEEALILALTLFITGCFLPFFIGPLATAYAVFNAVLVYLYSYKIKEYGFLGNVLVSYLGASSIIFGAIAVADYLRNYLLIKASILPSIYAFLLLLAREVVKTIEDVRADSIRNVRSLPRVAGVSTAYVFSASLLLAIVAISPLPYLLFNYGVTYLVLVTAADTILIYDTIVILRNLRNVSKELRRAELLASKLRSHLKVAIFVGTLAFLLDLIIRSYILLFY